MSRYLLIAALLTVVAGCSKTAYNITQRTQEGTMGLTTRIKAEVPESASQAEMQTWCDTIRSGEEHPDLVVVEFYANAGMGTKKGSCLMGKVYEGDSTVEIK